MPIKERLKNAIFQVSYKSSNDPQFLKHLKVKPKEDRRILQHDYEQMEPLTDHIGGIGTLVQDAKMIYNIFRKPTRESENYNKCRNNTKRCFHDMALARYMATGLIKKSRDSGETADTRSS